MEEESNDLDPVGDAIRKVLGDAGEAILFKDFVQDVVRILRDQSTQRNTLGHFRIYERLMRMVTSGEVVRWFPELPEGRNVARYTLKDDGDKEP